MVKVEDDYLINELKRGRYINVGLLCHNAYWYDITKLHKYYENFNVAFTADSIVHINDTVLKEFENSDLIIFDSSNYYVEDGSIDPELVQISSTHTFFQRCKKPFEK